MNGIVWAVMAGVSFGLFQSVNRRANQLVDGFRSTFGVVVVGALGLAVVVAVTQDLEAALGAPVAAFAFFAAAGVIHFFAGWTLLAFSQQRIGAARTGAVLAATPLMASILAAVILDEALHPVTWVGVALVTGGVALLSLRNRTSGLVRQSVPWHALGAAMSWSASPLFIRWGLERLRVPLVGVLVGLIAAAVAFAVFFVVRRQIGFDPTGLGSMPARMWVVIAGTIVAIAITAQWTAFDLIPIGVGYAVMQITPPVVIVSAPLIVGGEMERPTPTLLVAVAAILGGSAIVALTG